MVCHPSADVLRGALAPGWDCSSSEERRFRYHLTLKSFSTEARPLTDMAISSEFWEPG